MPTPCWTAHARTSCILVVSHPFLMAKTAHGCLPGEQPLPPSGEELCDYRYLLQRVQAHTFVPGKWQVLCARCTGFSSLLSLIGQFCLSTPSAPSSIAAQSLGLSACFPLCFHPTDVFWMFPHLPFPETLSSPCLEDCSNPSLLSASGVLSCFTPRLWGTPSPLLPQQ